MTDTQRVGSYCRILTDTPARYVGFGMGLAVSCLDNDLLAGEAHSFGEAVDLPYPTDREVFRSAGIVRACWQSFERELAALKEQVTGLQEAAGAALWNLEEGADVGAAMEHLAAVLPEE